MILPRGASAARRFEVISGERRRREWRCDEKLAIVAESFTTTTSISDVARRHQLNRTQLFQWRAQFRRGELGGPAVGPFAPLITEQTQEAPASAVRHCATAASLLPGALGEPAPVPHRWAGPTLHFLDYFRFYQSVAYSRFSYDDDLIVEGTDYPIKGKAQPAYPLVSLVNDLSVKYRGVDAGFTSTEYLRQPFSYENDLYGPNYWQVNGHIAYSLDSRITGSDVTFRLDANNLLDRKNIATLGVDGSPFKGDYQTMNRAAPRQLLFTISARY